MTYKTLVEPYHYKGLKDPQPSPLPPGTGVVSIEHSYGDVSWYPVYLAKCEDTTSNFEYFSDPYPGRVFLCYKDRRKAIGYLWRRWRRGDLEFSRSWYALLGRQCRLDYCSLGVVGNLYEHQHITVAEAEERLGLPKKFILTLIRCKAIKAHLVTSKDRSKGRAYFNNYYTFNLAHLEAYLDVHGYGKDYPSYAERQRELGDTRKLPAIIWCV